MSSRLFGMSVLAVDPGSTTGFALYDFKTNTIYADQLDAGRGRKERQRVHSGWEESYMATAAKRQMDKDGEINGVSGRSRGGGKESQWALDSRAEYGVVSILMDLVRAAGPRGVVVMEDFILGASGGGMSGKREGLSPVRIANRAHDRFMEWGLCNGDAWRTTGVPGDPDMRVRYEAVRTARLSGRLNVNPTQDDWEGGGWKWTMQMPGNRFMGLVGGEKAAADWLRRNGYWRPGKSWGHAMDATMHLFTFVRRFGGGDHVKLERMWGMSERPEKSKV